MVWHRGSVLVDTNVIIEAHRTGPWRALTGGYRVESVEECVTETQTGYQRRRREQQIDGAELRERLGAVATVDDLARAALAVRIGELALDEGEACLWAHALGRGDDWILCGPDRASLRCGVRLGFRGRLVSLEALLKDVGHRPGVALRPAYSREWQERVMGELVLAERGAKP